MLGALSVSFWQSAWTQPGVDFYQFWGLAKAQRESGYRLDSPYRAREAYQRQLQRLALAGEDPTLAAAVAARAAPDVTGTPFAYYAMGSLPGPYDRTLRVYRCAQVLAFVVAFFALARPLAPPGLALALAAATAAAFDPLLLDVAVANLNAVQLLGIALAVVSLQGHEAPRPLAVLALPPLLLLLVALKPIVAAAALLLALTLAWRATWRLRAIAAASAAVAATVLYALPCILFDSPEVWSDWFGEAFASSDRLAYGVREGNYSGVLLLAGAAQIPIVAAMTVIGGAMAASAGIAARGGWRDAAVRLLQDPLAAAALGVLALLALSPLVWSHYQVLGIVPALWLCRGGQPPARALGWTSLILLADAPRRVLAAWSSMPVPILDGVHAFSWVLLWVGALLVLRAASNYPARTRPA